MPFGVGGIVMATGSKAGGLLALIHSGAAVALLMNVKAVLTRRQPRQLRGDQQASSSVGEGDRPQAHADAGSADGVHVGLRCRRGGLPCRRQNGTCEPAPNSWTLRLGRSCLIGFYE